MLGALLEIFLWFGGGVLIALLSLWVTGSNWLAWAIWSGYHIFQAGLATARGDLVGTLTNLFWVLLFGLLAWWEYRKPRNKKKFRLGALGYKAQASRDRLVASMPQGKSPGINPV